MTDFYEDDEPVERAIAAFEAGEKRETAAPQAYDWVDDPDLDIAETEAEFDRAFAHGVPVEIVTRPELVR